MGIEHYIEFGGVNSSDYGIHVSGEGVFKAPERDVEHIEIPGRNGEFLLDKGRFKNIEVPYRIFNQEATYEEFISRIDAFRNAIVSKRGYQRLEDSFHPDEYRMASISQGMDVDPIQFAKASEFELVFDCKPQRFLKSGETEQNIASGDTITNPTLFESNPLLKVDGYGAININDDVISIQQGSVIGKINIGYYDAGQRYIENNTFTMAIDIILSDSVADKSITGDAIYSPSTEVGIVLAPETPPPQYDYDFLPSQSGSRNHLLKYESYGFQDNLLYLKLKIDPIKFTVGTAETKTDVYYLVYTYEDTQESVGGSSSIDFNITATYTPNSSFRFVIEYELPSIGEEDESRFLPTQDTVNRSRARVNGNVVLDSTRSAIGNLYIDLDIGEAYQIIDGSYVPINYAVTMPADLPMLKPGANDITFSNTITDLKITPRWWRI